MDKGWCMNHSPHIQLSCKQLKRKKKGETRRWGWPKVVENKLENLKCKVNGMNHAISGACDQLVGIKVEPNNDQEISHHNSFQLHNTKKENLSLEREHSAKGLIFEPFESWSKNYFLRCFNPLEGP